MPLKETYGFLRLMSNAKRWSEGALGRREEKPMELATVRWKSIIESSVFMMT